MQKPKPWLLGLLAVLVILAVAYVGFYFLYLDFLVDYWWFDSLGYGWYFFQRISYRYLVFGGVTLFFFLVFFLNFWAASRFLGTSPAEAEKKDKKRTRRYHDMARMFRTGSMKIYTPLSLVLSIFVALPVFEKWEELLFFLFGPKAGTTDPAFGIDVSFYLFSYPIHMLLEQRLLIAVAIVAAASLLLYIIERRMLAKTDQPLARGARIHLNIMALILAVLVGWGFFLKRYGLVFTTEHMPLFYGPGFTEMHITLPLIWAGVICWAAAAAGALYYLNFRRGLFPALGLIAVFAGIFALGNTTFLQGMVEKYIVLPNELSRQTPYIENSIEATLAAYGLSDVTTRQLEVDRIPWGETTDAIRANIENIPVWDRYLLEDVYEQLQSIRPYYNFTGVDVDRYEIDGQLQQVNLAARELKLEKLPGSGKNWINRHLQYTHGYGLAMTPAAQSGEHFMKWLIRGIPPESEFDLEISKPGIYFGQESLEYAIAPNDAGEIDYPDGDSFAATDYAGSTGIEVNSMFRKLLLSIYFKDRNIFFTAKTGKDSKILFRRNIREAVGHLTPYFKLDDDPYLVATEDGMFWFMDAYTRSARYPNSEPFDNEHNYIRNSIKIVMDAYNGTIDYYMADADDPVVQAYDRMYPGLLKPLEEMPENLRAHIRYPRDIFEIQAEIYTKYHQTDPKTFYQEEDLWEFAHQRPEEIREIGSQSMQTYYLTLDLIEEDNHEFMLISPMTPNNRPNLRAMVIAGCDGDRYGKFYVYSFPKGEQVYGPSQISALIDQNTEIAEQFTLWDQVGSEVKRGRMIILPIADVVFYIQPVYMSASSDLKIPQLQRLLVTQGDVVAMDVSLEKAFDQIRERMLSSGHPTQQSPPPSSPDTPAGEPGKTEPAEDETL
ncbi:hypothetical protein HNR65_001057 [Desulfosalsimonas propionicica]|uniref:UPF0182 protein HNR65_001057 n=1 Tax=Desulfosalsimonas propionicica TaxID=332175 RepID=A0A7W0C7T5_9BACT|nr:UPF0182 family protein [Desulfosalsimonas propionicica]MBA2880739.1 hypothetical protein [Desulfosalsimonas propionicica]